MAPQDRDALLAEITIIRASLFSGTHDLQNVDKALVRIEQIARQEDAHEKEAAEAHKKLDDELAKKAVEGHKAIETKREQAAKAPVKPTSGMLPDHPPAAS